MAALAFRKPIMDSLRDDFQEKNPTDEQIAEFVDAPEMDIPVFIEFMKGFLKANAAMFGDLGNSVREIVKQKMDEALQRSPAYDETQDDLAAAEAALEDEESEIPQS